MSRMKKGESQQVEELEQTEQLQPELNESVKSDAPRTKVKVTKTTIKFFNSAANAVEEQVVIGKLTVVQCKKFVADIAKENIFISKETKHEEFTVDSIALYQLKGV